MQQEVPYVLSDLQVADNIAGHRVCSHTPTLNPFISGGYTNNGRSKREYLNYKAIF